MRKVLIRLLEMKPSKAIQNEKKITSNAANDDRHSKIAKWIRVQYI